MPVQTTALIVYAESSGLSMDFREIPLASRTHRSASPYGFWWQLSGAYLCICSCQPGNLLREGFHPRDDAVEAVDLGVTEVHETG